MWVTVADQYLGALDQASGMRNSEGDRRTGDLAEWHGLLLDRLPDYDADDRLDKVAQHSALGGPELTFFQAQLARQRGDLDRARELLLACDQGDRVAARVEEDAGLLRVSPPLSSSAETDSRAM
jgi:hypothetical protein